MLSLPTVGYTRTSCRETSASMTCFGKSCHLSLAALLFLFVIAIFQNTYGQSPSRNWESAAGGSQQFEVVSVKQHKPNSSLAMDLPTSNFPLNSGDAYSSNGGLFSARNYRLDVYISFAYKLSPSQTQFVLSQLPKWALTDHFDIQARAKADATKDQMRLMMQSLLMDRFKLAVHTETRQVPVYAVALQRAGEIGPKLQPHTTASPPCDMTTSQNSDSAPTTLPGGLPAACGVLQTRFQSGRLSVGARNVSIDFIESYFPSRTMGNFDRPVMDQTGLTGNFDFTLEWTPEDLNLNGAKVALDPNGPTFLEALKDQLGLKLVSTFGSGQDLTIEHIEHPSQD